MGSLCSKSANEADPFAQPGRVLGNSSQPSSVPPPRNLTASTPGRTLGGSESTTAAEDARRAAARAAEVLLERRLRRAHNTLPTSNACSSNQTPAKPFYSHLYVLTLDHRSVQPSPQKARASSHRNSRHRRSRRETSFWPPAPSKSAVHVTPTRPLKRGATINGSGVYHGSRLSWGKPLPPKSLLLQSYPES
jgi:hypothetical protein